MIIMVDRLVPCLESTQRLWACSADGCSYEAVSSDRPKSHKKHPFAKMVRVEP